MENSLEVKEAWWVYRKKRLDLESLSIEVSGKDGGSVEVHAAGTLKGRVTGLDPGDTEVEFQFLVDDRKYRIAQAQVFDVEHLPTGHSVVHLTGILELIVE